jgi:hypothetical protein
MKTIFVGVDKPAGPDRTDHRNGNYRKKRRFDCLGRSRHQNQYLAKGIGLLVDSTPPEIIDRALKRTDPDEEPSHQCRHDVALLGRHRAGYGHDRYAGWPGGHAAKT